MPIPFHKAHITEDEVSAVSQTMRSGWLTMGPKTLEFETKFKEFIGIPHAISMNSATAALHLALKAIGLKAGDEVIVPTTTFVATAEVVTYFGAIPVFCDAEESTHNLNTKLLKSLITPRTKAIIPVHFGGIPADMDTLLDIADEHELKVIEDAAHALPASHKGRAIGTLSDITCFSFYATKTLACGEGGMATTDNEIYAQSMKINRLHGISRDAWDRYTQKGNWYYEVVDNGCKYNMTDLNAALGVTQLKKVQWMCDERAKIAAKYDAAFKPAGLSVLEVPEHCESAWHLYVLKVANRDALMEALKAAEIGFSLHFIPVHLHPYYRDTFDLDAADYPVANRVYSQSVSLPIYPGLTDEQIEHVIQVVLKHAKRVV